MEKVVSTVCENQRLQLITLGWAACAFQEYPWTDLQGNPVTLQIPPCHDMDNHWVVEDGADTDEDGWTYGTTFENLAFPRDGGRATKRSTDWVRRRVWRRSTRADHANMAYVLNVYKQKRWGVVGWLIHCC